MNRKSRAGVEERRSDAKVVLDRYRGPLLDAAWQLGDRLDSIRHRGFLSIFVRGQRSRAGREAHSAVPLRPLLRMA